MSLRVVSSEPTEYNGGITLEHGTVLGAESRYGVVSLLRVIGKQGDGGGSEKWDMTASEAYELGKALRKAAYAAHAFTNDRDGAGEA